MQFNRVCPDAVKESRSERVGLYQYAQGGFACLTRLKIAMSLHQCQRSNRRKHRLHGGNNTDKQERTTITSRKCNTMMHAQDMK